MEVQRFLRVLIILSFVHQIFCGVTMDQLKQTAVLLRQSCQPRFKLTDEQADLIRDGTLPDYKEGKCYVNCLLEMLGVVKKGKMLVDKAIKSAETMLPPEMKDDFINGINMCKDLPLGKDPCENAYLATKCTYENNPQFFLP